MTSADTERRARPDVQLAEVVAAIALAADLGTGQPLDHVLRSCVIATRFADHLGVTQEERDATYWTTLFLTAGCTGVSYEMSILFGDDIAFRAGASEMAMASPLGQVRFLLKCAGSNRGFMGRTRVRAGFFVGGIAALEESLLAHCAVSARMAERLGLGDEVAGALRQTFAQWDGKGLPRGVGGEDIRLASRIANVANMVEVVDREQGVDGTRVLLRHVGGSEVDPHLAAEWVAVADAVLEGIDLESSWERVLNDQPAGRGPLTEDELDDALELLADYADLKSPWFTGHSRGVAYLAVESGRHLGLPEPELTVLRRAALVHDLGRNGIANSIWDKPAELSETETERVRLHAYYVDRMLNRAGGLAVLAEVASAAHERSGGSGYPRAIGGASVPLLARVLAAADTYHALREDRPHRPAWPRADAEAELRRMARAGELDGSAVDAVLAAAGHPVRHKPTAPAGLTPREVEVLVLAARGATTKAVARSLGIAPKTAGNHIEVQGDGPPVVLLHGGLCTAETWGAEVPALAERYTVYVPERRGHGRTPDVDGPITYEVMTADTIAFMDALGVARAHLVGWSDGAIVGLLVALERPDLVAKLVMIGQNLDLDGYAPHFREMLDSGTLLAEPPPMLRDMYAAVSPDGPEHFDVVFGKLAEVYKVAPDLDLDVLAEVAAPTLVLCGDDDIISVEHAADVVRRIPDAQLGVVPGTSHALPLEKPGVVNQLVLDFLADEQAPKFMGTDG